jgi:hypothetical protein
MYIDFDNGENGPKTGRRFPARLYNLLPSGARLAQSVLTSGLGRGNGTSFPILVEAGESVSAAALVAKRAAV